MDVRAQTLIPLLALAALLAAPAARAQMRDPLTPQEAGQVRNTAGHLDKRVPLLLSFAAARLRQFETARATPVAAQGRSSKLYGLLQQYQNILPELDDAVDDLASSGQNPRGPQYKLGKVLPKAILLTRQLQATLRHIQQASSPADLATYHFALQTCIDATRDSLQAMQQDLADARHH